MELNEKRILGIEPILYHFLRCMVIRYVYISFLEKEFDTFDAVTISDITMLSIPRNLTYVI